MSSEVKPRLLREQIPNAHFAMADGSESPASTGWDAYETLTSPARITKVFFGYFDLSGYTLEQKTMFIQNVMFQNVGNYRLGGMQSGFGFDECRIVSITPLSMDDFNTSSHSTWNVPGAPTSNFSTQLVVRGTMTEFELDVGAAVGRMYQESNWGVGDSTAADKLYYARAFRFPRQSNAALPGTYFISVPAVNVVIPAMITTEPDLEYMMRLKRSVETV